jgi:molybdopterin-guanine dinucleotide biosynthesis protein
MTQILHIIGQQGVGKSTLAQAIKAAHEARGVSCENLTEAGVHEPGMPTNIQHIREHGYRAPYSRTWTRPDVLIVEHLGDPLPKQVSPGDLLIRLERAA